MFSIVSIMLVCVNVNFGDGSFRGVRLGSGRSSLVKANVFSMAPKE